MPTNRTLLGSYLRARRSLVQPEDVALPRERNRRVDGLRRQEVAALADISPDYYLRLEQGRHQQPSEQVLAAIGRALLLDEDAMDYLLRISRPVGRTTRRSAYPAAKPDEGMTCLLECWSHTPAVVIDRNQDVVTANRLAAALGGGHLDPGNNLVLSTFEPVVRTSAEEWEDSAHRAVAALRFHADPDDPRLREIVGSLSHRDADFRRIWARHDARPQRSGRLRSHIDGFGFVDLRFQNFSVPGHTGHTLSTFYADPDSRGAVALTHLGDRLQRQAHPAPVSMVPATMRAAG